MSRPFPGSRLATVLADCHDWRMLEPPADMRDDIETLIRVMVAAESAVARAGLEALVAASPLLELAGSASTLPELAGQVEPLDPDVALLAVDGAESLADAGLAGPGVRSPAFVVITDDARGPSAAALFRAGARGLLPGGATGEEIIAAIVAVASGLVALHPEVAESLLSDGLSEPSPDAEDTRAASRVAGGAALEGQGRALTPREIEVLNLMAQGLGNKEIAWRLHISEHTVKFHISSVFTKLDVSGRTEAVTAGLRWGLIML